MKGYRSWLTGITMCAMLVPLSAVADVNKPLSGSLEAGAAAINVKDDIKQVSEYSTLRTKNGVNPYGKADLSVHQGGVVFDGTVRFMDAVDQDHSANLDYKRIFRTDFSYSVMQHWLDHDKMLYLDAAIPSPSSYTGTAANPLPLTPNNVPAFWYNPIDPANPLTPAYGGASGAALPGYTVQQIGRASVFGEDLTPNAVFSIKRSELTSKSDLTIPQLPNLTFHFGFRNEDRKGMEQSIGMSKCTSCHVTGQSRDVDENTRDITAGVTGKFGLLTLDYSFLDREFRENATPPSRYYDPALSPGAGVIPTYYTGGYVTFDNRILYDYRDGLLRYDETPDSKKESHIIKAKVDLQNSTSVMASYVKSTVDSGKTGEPGNFSFNGSNGITLRTTYDAYGAKLSSKFGKDLTINVRGRSEHLRSDDVGIAFSTVGIPTAVSVPPVSATNNNFVPSADSLVTRYSSLSSDTVTTGIDAVYRLARRTTLRLGYDFQLLDRHDEHLQDTKTHTIKASINTRPGSTVSGRAAVSYKAIDNPYHNPNAALTNITNSTATTVTTGPTYGVSLYDERTSDLSNQPDNSMDGVLSGTWSPSPYYSVTAMYRIKKEENDLDVSSWNQLTQSPALTVWYAPDKKINMTFAYNYMDQTSETAFCQGWYDG
ncbi:MAG: GSU2204 family CXXCH-containing (seleno)protein [Desulfuromonadaceae bacterium]|nr:GSU2204 family CXXCH-containing (seleno)protein [Desulfuromonadaceae bacterium]MDD2855366.1 GSU2204 family CXXCH-containing (seleno)protein [Desulfuromonadaceae bacterium]